MNSMYETIMSLPLFYGINNDQVSQFVARTHLHFTRYKEGDTIMLPGEPVDEVKVVLSGNVSFIHQIENTPIAVEETCCPGRMIGVERLFGINNRSPFKAVTSTPAGIMSFTKEEYMHLLHSETIYMVNYINYLAARAQRPLDIMLARKFNTLADYVAGWLQLLTEPKSKNYLIRCSVADLHRYTNLDEDNVKAQINEMVRENLIKYEGSVMTIKDRMTLIEKQMSSMV